MAPIRNNPTIKYPTSLKVLANTAVGVFLSSPVTSAMLKTPKPVFIGVGLIATATLATRGWEIINQNDKVFPSPKK